MPKPNKPAPPNIAARIVGFIIFLALLVAGLLLGTQSKLTLTRDAAGSVTAINAWTFAGRQTLISHSVANFREVKFEEMSLTEEERRSSTSQSRARQIMVLVGDGQFAYPYQEDAGLIRSFLNNSRNPELVLGHPIDIRRKVASWLLLTLVALSAAGWIVTLSEDTALMMAIQMRRPALAFRLLDASPDLGISDSNGRTPLHAAAERGDAAMVRLMLKSGADVNLADSHGWTPLFFAAASGSEDAVRALLDAGANTTRKLPDGRIAADLASFGGELGQRLRGAGR